MRCADISSAENHPTDIVAEDFEIADDLVEPEGEVPANVLADEQTGAQGAEGVDDERP